MQSRFTGSSSDIGVKGFLLLFLICWCQQLCLAQKDQKLDSLLGVLQKVKDDTSKVNALNELSILFYKKSNYTNAIKYADDALILSEKTQFSKGIGDAYRNLGISYRKQSNYEEAKKYTQLSLNKFEELGNKRGIANSYVDFSSIAIDLGNYEDAKKAALKALKIGEEMGYKLETANSYLSLGTIYYFQSNYTEALKNYLGSLDMFKAIGNKNGMLNCLNNIGNINRNQGNYTESLNSYLASLGIAEEIDDKNGIANSLSNMGLVYRNLGNHKEALRNHFASLKIKQEIGNLLGMANSYSNIGITYRDLGNYADALDNFQASIKIREEIGDKKGMANPYNNIGLIYLDQRNFEAASKNLLTALKIREEIGDRMGIAGSNINLGLVLCKVVATENDQAKKLKYDESLYYLNKGLSIAKEIGAKEFIQNAYSFLAELDSLMGNHQQALEHFKSYTIYKDSLLNETNSKTIAEMKTKYETEKKDKEIQQLESEKQISNLQLMVQHESLNRIHVEKAKIQSQNLFNLQQVELLSNEQKLQQLEIDKNQAELIAQKSESEKKQNQLTLLAKEGEIQKLEIRKQTLFRNYLIGGLILFGLLSFFVYNNYSTRQKLKLQTLRNKIASDLHDDVGSTLSSISIFSQIAQEQSREVIPMLDTIGESSRKMLDAMADIVWTINPENDQFEKIILRMRSFAYELLGAKGIDFEFSADEDIAKIKLPMEVRKNLYLIFKEATNNMVKYAEASKATFSIKGEKDNLSLMIRDNGKGFDMNQSNEGNGIKNMKNRAKEIGAELMIDSYPGSGTTIHLKIMV